jgi:MFS family permease
MPLIVVPFRLQHTTVYTARMEIRAAGTRVVPATGTVSRRPMRAAQFRAVSESGIKPAPCGDHSITIIRRRTAVSWQAVEKRRQQKPGGRNARRATEVHAAVNRNRQSVFDAAHGARQFFQQSATTTSPMKFGFYIILAAQFFSSLADNALLVAAIALLVQAQSPDWLTPMLKLFFTVSYVAVAPFVGAFADALPKGHVMFITNTIKIAGCVMMLTGVNPLLAYGIVGLGAAAYSPAKYGILTEYLPHRKLVIANGWMEGLTVLSIILGTVLGGVLISNTTATWLLTLRPPYSAARIDTAPQIAIVIITVIYIIAAIINLYIPRTGVDHRIPHKNPYYLVRDFAHCIKLLWSDRLGQISLATTTLFWGAGATLQFIVLKWAQDALGYTLSQATMLQGIVAVGVAGGALAAARLVPLTRAVRVIPVGVAMGIIVMVMVFVRNAGVAMALMVVIGGLSGFLVVPMNALLQHRGHILMGAGHSIAVQNFNENISILAMLGLYSLFIALDFSIDTVIVLFGLFVAVAMVLVRKRHQFNERNRPLPTLPAELPH